MLKNSKPFIGFNDRWARLIGIPAVGLLIIVGLMPVNNGSTWLEFGISWFISSFFSFVYWEGSRTFTLWIWGRFPKVKDVRKRLLWQVAFFFIYGFIVTIILRYLVECVLMGHEEVYYRVSDFAVSYLITFAGIGSYEAMRFFYQLRQTSIEKEAYKRRAVQAELEGLRAQVNPHFLFNSLNTLTYLIPEDTERSVRFVRQLSKTYRYILETREEPLISLREELNFIKAYVFLLQQRFEDNLKINVDSSATYLNRMILPLSLQLLIENAIKHNIVSDAKPLIINVLIEEDKLLVKNNLQLKQQVQNSTKVGLENIKKRYAYFTEEAVEVEQNDRHFIVKLPLIKIP